MAYFAVKSVVWLLGRLHGLFCGLECVVAIRKSSWLILW